MVSNASKRNSGFTLIEMTVVIGVLLLLMSMAVYGYKMLSQAASNKSTETRLQLCSSVFSEYQLVNNLGQIEGNQSAYAPVLQNGVSSWVPNNPLYATNSVLSFNNYPSPAASYVYAQQAWTPQSVVVGSSERYSKNNNHAVLNTSVIMQLCAASCSSKHAWIIAARSVANQ